MPTSSGNERLNVTFLDSARRRDRSARWCWPRPPGLLIIGVVIIGAIVAAMVLWISADDSRRGANVRPADLVPAIPRSELPSDLRYRTPVNAMIRSIAEDQNGRDAVLQATVRGEQERDQALAALDRISASDFHNELIAMLHRNDPDAVWYAIHPAAMQSALGRCSHLVFRDAECHAAYLAALAHDRVPKGFDPNENLESAVGAVTAQLRRSIADWVTSTFVVAR